MVTTVTAEAFDAFVKDCELPVFVDFWAAWCAPCRSFSGIIDALAEDYDGKIQVGKVNVEEEPALSEKFHIMSIPSVCVFSKGELVETIVGSRSYEDMENYVGMYLV